ncbi:hypothetical protein Fmac_026376 [Flemingia macrophylla]|uniref:Uncharacterized protein n=1 Tax=Flemingia macrophylla TaxID=520843 RepID=A0ABD1LEP3_9FABA
MLSEGEGLVADVVSLVTVIPACAALGDLNMGMVLHGLAFKLGVGEEVMVNNSLGNYVFQMRFLEGGTHGEELSNTLLSADTSSAMLHAAEDPVDTSAFAKLCSDLGTPWVLDPVDASASAKLCSDLGKPWVLNPVDASASAKLCSDLSTPWALDPLNISNILLRLHHDPRVTNMAHTYMIFSLPELLTHSFLHPIRIYLRTQGITHPITLASLLGTLLHFLFNYVIVTHLGHEITDVTAASNFSIFLFPVLIILCGLHVHPTATVASMGFSFRPLHSSTSSHLLSISRFRLVSGMS